MADERVSILGVLEDKISGPMAKMSQGAEKVAESVKKADSSVKSMTTSTEGVDKATVQMIGRSTRLIQRLLGIQQALQVLSSLSPGGMGKFQQTLDAGSAAMGAFSSIVALFPNKLGILAGAAAAAGAAVATLSQKAAEAEAKLAALKEQIKVDQAAVSGERAKPLVEALLGNNAQLFEAELGLSNIRAQVERVAVEVNTARLNLDKAIAGGDDLVIFRAQVEFDKVGKRALKLAADYKAAKDNLDALKFAESATKFKADTNRALKEIDVKLHLGLIDPLEALQEKAKLAEAALTLLFTGLREFPESEKIRSEIDGVTKGLQTFREEIGQLEAFRKSQQELFGKGVPAPDSKKPDPVRNPNDVFGGMAEGFQEASAHLADMNALGVQLGYTLSAGVGGFTDTLIDGLISGNLELKEFAQQFLVSIAKMIAQALILQAIMAGLKAIGGFNEGGEVQPVARATGGPIPGPNVDRDVVPAMLTPGEYVIRKSAVQHYGVGVMEALNNRMLDASGLRGTSAPSIYKAERYYAGGGEVGGPMSSASPTPVFAIVPPTEQNMERMLNGGLPALFKVFEQHKETIRGKLGIRGR